MTSVLFRIGAAGFLLMAGASCAAPQVDEGAYLQDSLSTAETVSSYLATTSLTVAAVQDGSVFTAPANVILSEADQSLGETVLTYSLIEPPASGDDVREQVLDVSLRAQHAVFSALTSVRREDPAALAVAQQELSVVDRALSEVVTQLEARTSGGA